MKQYCRYCAWCTYGDIVWCDKLDKTISLSSAKSINNCKHFLYGVTIEHINQMLGIEK